MPYARQPTYAAPRKVRYPILIPAAVGAAIWWFNPFPILGLVGITVIGFALLVGAGVYVGRKRIGI